MAVALGGFLIFVGIILIGVFALAFYGFIDVSIFESEEYRTLFMLVLLVVSVLDVASGIMLARR